VVTNSLRLLGGPAWRPGDRPAQVLPAGPRRPAVARFARALATSPVPLAAAEAATRLPAAAGEALRRHRGQLRSALVLALAGLWLLSGVMLIPPGQVGVVQRFGRLVAPRVPPGLHYHLPWPVEAATLVDVGLVRR